MRQYIEYGQRHELVDIRTDAQDTWVSGFHDGLRKWPETRIGVMLAGFNAVLQSPPVDWREFATSQLTVDQIARSGSRENSGVQQSQWGVFIAHTVARLLVSGDPGMRFDWNRDYSAPVSMTEANIAHLNAVMQDPAAAEGTARLQAIAQTAAGAVMSEDTNALHLRHLELIMRHKPYDDRRRQAALEMRERVWEQLRENHPGQPTDWVLFAL